MSKTWYYIVVFIPLVSITGSTDRSLGLAGKILLFWKIPVQSRFQEFSDFDSSTSDAKIPPCSISFDGELYSATFPLSNTRIFYNFKHLYDS